MNLYAHDLTLLDFNYGGFPDSVGDPLSHRFLSPASLFHGEDDDFRRNISYDHVQVNGSESAANRKIPSKHRHDGKSPLPLGMDWSAPPGKWDGRNTVWPHDSQTGWSYCVTVPSWIHLPTSSVSDPVVFYRVQLGLQSPEGISVAKLILRRFSDFLELYSSIKKEFPKKRLPQAPPKKILRMKSQALLEERRCFLEEWMGKLLSDIDISRSAPVATFLELEAAVRFYFSDEHQQEEDANAFLAGDIQPFLPSIGSSGALIPGTSSVTSDHVNDSADEASDVGTPNHIEDGSKLLVSKNSPSTDNVTDWHELITKYGFLDKNLFQEKIGRLSRIKFDITTESGATNGDDPSSGVEYQNLDGSITRFSAETVESDSSLFRDGEALNSCPSNLLSHGSVDLNADANGEAHPAVEADIKCQSDLVITFHTDERQRLNRVIDTMKQRLQTAKADVEDLIARLNQEVAVRQFLSTKVKDLEVEVEMTRESYKQGMEQTVLNEKERYTQIQWDMEELHKQCMEMELSLNSLKDEKAELETTNQSLLQENEMLLQEMIHLKDKLEDLRDEHGELELKSKADMKVLIKEVKSLRTYQSELKQELSRLMREKLETERIVEREKKSSENAKTANEKLLHECDILRNRLQECSVNFLVEEDNKLIMNGPSPSDAVGLLATSDNRIGLLLAEAQLLAQDVEKLTTASEQKHETDSIGPRTDDAVRKMLAEVLLDNASLRKQMNSVLRCALAKQFTSGREAGEEEDEEEEKEEKESIPLGRTVLSKFLEK